MKLVEIRARKCYRRGRRRRGRRRNTLVSRALCFRFVLGRPRLRPPGSSRILAVGKFVKSIDGAVKSPAAEICCFHNSIDERLWSSRYISSPIAAACAALCLQSHSVT